MGRRGKDDDDAALWDKIARTASPLKRRESRPPADKGRAPAPKPPTPEPPPLRAKAKTAAATAPKTAHVPRADGIDRQTARQLVKGRLEVEARLDLHGLRQRDAHAQLHRFLKQAQTRGLRHVLVITGKGAPPQAPTSFYEEEERGVLRNAVPRWLAEPDLAPLVVSFAPAPRPLGGNGALYVRLRRALRR
jgi:DNA-nicking Smr family endonuclease